MTGSHVIAALGYWRRAWVPVPVQLTVRGYAAFVGLFFAANVAIRTIWPDLTWWALAGVLLSCAAIAVLLVAIGHVRNPAPVVDLDADELRIGSQTTPFVEVTQGSITRIATRRRDDLYLWIGAPKQRHVMVALRERGVVLSEGERGVLAAMVERSSIRLPAAKRDAYDPKGKFSWLDQQGFATKEQVLGALRNTPVAGDVSRA